MSPAVSPKLLTLSRVIAAVLITTTVSLFSPLLAEPAAACSCAEPGEVSEEETIEFWRERTTEADGAFTGTVTGVVAVNNGSRPDEVIYTLDVSLDAKDNLDDTIHILAPTHDEAACNLSWNVGDTAVSTIEAKPDGTLESFPPSWCDGDLTEEMLSEFTFDTDVASEPLGAGNPPSNLRFLRSPVLWVVAPPVLAVIGLVAYARRRL